MPLNPVDVSAPIGKGYLPPRLRLYGCPLPLADESLSSWLIRVGANYILPVKEVIEYCFGSGLSRLFSADPDIVIIERIQQSLASKLGISPERFSSLVSLTPRELGWPSESWLVESLNYALQTSAFCPQCLASDPEPYFRNQWRYAAVKECSLHGCQLLRKCPHCQFPVHPYRHKTGRAKESRQLATCPHCKNDLHGTPTGMPHFNREGMSQRPSQEIPTRPFLMNPPRKKPRKDKGSSRKSTRSSSSSATIRSPNASPAMELDSLNGEWNSETKARYLLCLRNPKYRLASILQEREEYYEYVAEKVARCFFQFTKYYAQSAPTLTTPPFSLPSLASGYLTHTLALPTDLPKVVSRTALRLNSELAATASARAAQIIAAGISQCEDFLAEREQEAPPSLRSMPGCTFK